jgi:hypothetical protein
VLDGKMLAVEDRLPQLGAADGNLKVFLAACNLLDEKPDTVLPGLKRHLEDRLPDAENAVKSNANPNASAIFDFNEAFPKGGRFRLLPGHLTTKHVLGVAMMLKYSLWYRGVQVSKLPVGDEGAIAIFETIRGNTLISEVRMSGAHLTHKSMPIALNTSITHLVLSFNDIGLKGAEKLRSALPQFARCLKELQLESCKLPPHGIAMVLEAIGGGAGSENSAAADAAPGRKPSSRFDPQLRILNLSGNKIEVTINRLYYHTLTTYSL